jgi:hypothetical protein
MDELTSALARDGRGFTRSHSALLLRLIPAPYGRLDCGSGDLCSEIALSQLSPRSSIGRISKRKEVPMRSASIPLLLLFETYACAAQPRLSTNQLRSSLHHGNSLRIAAGQQLGVPTVPVCLATNPNRLIVETAEKVTSQTWRSWLTHRDPRYPSPRLAILALL